MYETISVSRVLHEYFRCRDTYICSDISFPIFYKRNFLNNINVLTFLNDFLCHQLILFVYFL